MAGADAIMRQIDQMFDDVGEQVEDIVKVYFLKFTAQVIIDTPGPGNQYPLSEYVAKGMLRAAWQYRFSEPPATSSSRTGTQDRTDKGLATQAKIATSILSQPVQQVAYLYNRMLYAYIVHEGIGTHAHIGKRPFLDDNVARSHQFAAEARRDVMGKAR